MIYYGEGLGETWARDNSAYHEEQSRHPLCGTRVVLTDSELKECGRRGIITKVTDGSPVYKITLKEDLYSEEFIFVDDWQFKIVRESK